MSRQHLSIFAISQLLLTKCWQNFVDPIFGALMFLNQIFVGPTFFWQKLFWGKFFRPTILWTNIFLTEFFWQEFCFDQHIVYPLFWTNFLEPIFTKIVFGSIFFFVYNYIFGTTFFFENILLAPIFFGQNFFLPKWRWPQRGTKIQPNLDKSKFALSLAQLSPRLYYITVE